MTPVAPAADDRAIRRGAALVDPPHELLWVRGEDAASFLEGLLSRRVESAPIGSVRRSLLLSPRGKLVSPLWILRGAERIGLVADTGSGEAVLETLQRFRLRVDAVVDRERAVVSEVWGPEAATVVATATGIEPAVGGWVGASDTVVAHLPFRHIDLARWLVAGTEPSALLAAGAVDVDREAATSVRIEAGEPRMGVDMDSATIPHEVDLVSGAVDFDKGCYLGQELVARIESRGHANRRLTGVYCAGEVIPAPGATLSSEGREVGTLTSVARSTQLGAAVGLGLVRSEVAAGTSVAVHWNGRTATAVLQALPFSAPGNG